MASPFRLFRKYMKPMLAVFVVMLMFVFVIGDPLMQLFGGNTRGRGGEADGTRVVVTWKEGQLTGHKLRSLVERRHILAAFIQAVFTEGYYAAQQEGAEDLGLTVRPFDFLIQPPQSIERDVVQTQVFADAARRMGMVVTDDEVRDYLDGLGRNRVSFEQMKSILDRLSSQRRRITSQYILDAVREELLRQNYLSSYQYAMNIVMPDQRWTDWLKANDRIIVEAAALKTSDYMDQVPEPTDAQIRELYEKYKDREVVPDFEENTLLPSATPGFQIPRKLTLQYLEGNYDAYLQKLMDSISEEEIAKYYEENKELFVKAVSGEAEAAPPEETPADEDPMSEMPADDAASELFEAPPKPQPKTEAGESADAPVGSDTKPSEPPSDKLEPASPENGQSSDTASDSPFRLVALQEETATEQPAAEETPQAEPTAESEAADSPAKPTTETPAKDESKPADEPAATDTAESQPEYQPLDEVRDEIRRLLAGNKVADQLRETMDRLMSELNNVYLSYFDKQLTARSNKQPEPQPPAILQDLEPLAEPNGLQFHKTEPLSLWELRELPVGQSVDANESVEQRLRLLQMAFVRLKNYEPVVTRDLDGNQYLVIKTSDIPERVPPLKEIRDQVVETWKRERASKLAFETAKQAAEQIEKDGVTIGDKFANDPNVEVVVTDPFTWLTVGDVSPTTQMVTFRLSEAAPIVAAGPEFMKTVFQLGEGDVGTAFNNDHSIAYVVRVQQHLEGREEMQQAFLSEVFRWFGAQTMQAEHRQQAANDLVDGLLTEAGVDWKRPPDQRESDE